MKCYTVPAMYVKGRIGTVGEATVLMFPWGGGETPLQVTRELLQ